MSKNAVKRNVVQQPTNKRAGPTIRPPLSTNTRLSAPNTASRGEGLARNAPRKSSTNRSETNVRSLGPTEEETDADEENFVQIGDGKDRYTMSVAVTASENLAHLGPVPEGRSVRCYLAATFVGVEIFRSSPFGDLNQTPNFADVSQNHAGASCLVSLRSSDTELQAFFRAQTAALVLSVVACQVTDLSSETTLGESEIDLSGLVGDEVELRSVRGVYLFRRPSSRLQNPPPQSTDDLVPFAEIFVLLTKEVAGLPPPSPVVQNPSLKLQPPTQNSKQSSSGGMAPVTSAHRASSAASAPFPTVFSDPPMSEFASHDGFLDGDHDELRHFRFGVDLRSIKDLKPLTPVSRSAAPPLSVTNVYIRYSYPAFGSAAPVLTAPPIPVPLGTEVSLPNSFKAFEFAMDRARLYATLASSPLLVEVIHKDEYMKDVQIGIATVRLSDILQERAIPGEPDHHSVIRAYDSYAAVCAFEDENTCRKVGLLRVMLTMEDFGSLPTPSHTLKGGASLGHGGSLDEPAGAGAAFKYEIMAKGIGERNRGIGLDGPAVPGKQNGSVAESAAGWELEMWRQSEEAKFRASLKEKEAQRMQALEDEWKRREREREALFAKKQAELASLETRVKQSMFDVEKREQKLVLAEEASQSATEAALRDANRKVLEVQDASRRLKEEYTHQLNLEKKRYVEIESQLSSAQERLKASEEHAKKVEEEFQRFKTAQRQSPEAALQAEVSNLTAQRTDLERRLEAMTKAKRHYKEQLTRCLKELGRMRRALQADVQARLGKERSEVEQMRLQLLAKEETKALEADRVALTGIRQELQQLKMKDALDGLSPSPGASPTPGPSDLNARHHIFDGEAPSSQQPPLFHPPPSFYPHSRDQSVASIPFRDDRPYVLSPNPSTPFRHISRGNYANSPSALPYSYPHTHSAVMSPHLYTDYPHSHLSPVHPHRFDSMDNGRIPSYEIPPDQRSPITDIAFMSQPAVNIVPSNAMNRKPPEAQMAKEEDGQTRREEIQRLLKERSDLISTGAYSDDDSVIKEIDNQIATYSDSKSGH